MKQVSEYYLLGIQEGREWVENFGYDDLEEHCQNLKETMRMFSSGPVRDTLKGELDFFKNQIKIKGERNA